ncbi:MAG: glycoside hydrolase family 32 protein, partial [Planctomycetales bacterium]|nr:glycoside hydrolase family 32 protein [Planctomycetales bacterium]
MNWMNDPNGLVFFQGEYHLFYQHNPHGNTWGHMSWGHAVSRDLVHWEHLPIALHDEYGVMIFSGCCVVDHHNTSGFGKDGQAPLVAIYTGHGYGKQTQDLAYSTDEGRTWTKYAQNPVIDLNEADFRDPKVFWHEPTQKWIMVVSLAVQKKLQFYGSTNLKQWNLLSEFGPAGAQEKPNWECPDLFELPIEGQPGQSRWVLEVDM